MACTVPPVHLFCIPETFGAVVTVNLPPIHSSWCRCRFSALVLVLPLSPSPDSITLWARLQLVRGCWGQDTEGDSTSGSLGQPLGCAVSSSKESCTAEAGCAGWSLPSCALFHPNNPNNPPLCLHLLLHSASGARWKSCLCPLLCPAAEWPARCPGASLEWDVAKGMCCRL